MKLITVVTPCCNEEGNIAEVYEQVKKVFANYGRYRYKHLFIDNASTDRTAELLKDIAKNDKNVLIIINTKNFGHVRSPYHAILQAKGDAIICIAADLQDPPRLIRDFIAKWEEGYNIVIGTKKRSKENIVMFSIRKLYYRLIKSMAETEILRDFTGFGLYNREFIEVIREMKEPYPYFRGLVSEFGYKIASIEYVQPRREKGITKNNFYTLYDLAMLGFVNHSKLLLRLSSFIGFGLAIVSLGIAGFYLIYKLLFWNQFSVGTAPVAIGLFFFSAVQLFFVGIIGEYIGAIHTQIKNKPLVVEKERINFENEV
jgi:glycosyltransferase involved in cell wall biosynthesis